VKPRPRVLLVDDNAALLDNLREILEAEGYEVLSATTAREAIDRASQGFDVGLVDLRLPDESGTSLAARLREAAPEAEIVLLTGYASLETAIAAVRAGAFAYLVKPCSTPELLLTIEQALLRVQLHGEKRDLARRTLVAEKLAAIGTMTAGLSHEIRNPLNAAALQLVVLERGIRRLPEPLQPGLLAPLGLVRDEIKRLEHLLEDFLQFARPREMTGRPVALAEPVEAVLGLLAADAERRQIVLECGLEPGLRVSGDSERLRQVLMNLLLNALEAMSPGGRLRVSAHVEREEVILWVDDSGPGIAEAARARIFEPFFSTKAGGSGLGLPIVHAIIMQHGGTIAMKPSPLGGARVEMRFPALLRSA
jgi:two-component system sensor histidine kinase HydH